MKRNEFHLQRFDPCEPHWPAGGWSLYQISGDEIAQRVVFDKDGKAVRRDSWCGFLGCFETLQAATDAIEAAKT
jgi:hypothetical protein